MTRFLVDRMLGQTAKWLRLLGIDAKYAPEGEDDKLLEIAEEEDRIVITRDKELGRKDKAILVDKAPPEEVIKEVLKKQSVEIKPLTRCSKCNEVVEKVEKQEVEKRVSDNVYDRNNEFWYCEGCDQYYWKGSHWKKIMDNIEDILGCERV